LSRPSRPEPAGGAWDTTRNRPAGLGHVPRDCLVTYTWVHHDRQFALPGVGQVWLTGEDARLADSQVAGTGRAVVLRDVWILKLELDFQPEHGADVCRVDGGISRFLGQVVQPEAGEKG